MFDHNIFQDNLVGVDFCEQMVKETNPSVLGEGREDRGAARRRCTAISTIADIMTRAQPVHRRVLPRDAAREPLHARDVLPDGRPARPPSTLYPGGVGTVPTVQLFTDYLVRLMKYVEFMKKVVPLHDDLFDFFYEALPGYEKVGQRRILLGCWGSFNNPDVCDYTYKNMSELGPRHVRHARRRRRRQAGDHRPGRHQPEHPHPARQLVLRRLGRASEMFVKTGSARQPGRPAPSRGTRRRIPRPQKRDFNGNYTWVMSPRWFDKRTGDHLALDTGGGPIARFWATALAGLVDIGYVKATGHSVKIYLPKTAIDARGRVRVEDPEVEQRHRARPRPDLLPGLRGRGGAATSSRRRWPSCTPAGPRPGPSSRCRTRRSAAASTRRCAACCRTTS